MHVRKTYAILTVSFVVVCMGAMPTRSETVLGADYDVMVFSQGSMIAHSLHRFEALDPNAETGVLLGRYGSALNTPGTLIEVNLGDVSVFVGWYLQSLGLVSWGEAVYGISYPADKTNLQIVGTYFLVTPEGVSSVPVQATGVRLD